MKTICFYFQVHQPWRLKRYRFFDMGRDHNYLDDLTNRSIMQKVARECYLPMNALLFNLIRQSEGRFRCTFSLTGLAVEQINMPSNVTLVNRPKVKKKVKTNPLLQDIGPKSQGFAGVALLAGLIALAGVALAYFNLRY